MAGSVAAAAAAHLHASRWTCAARRQASDGVAWNVVNLVRGGTLTRVSHAASRRKSKQRDGELLRACSKMVGVTAKQCAAAVQRNSSEIA